MTKITESEIETFTIELLEKQGYHYIYGPDIAPDSDTSERSSFEENLIVLDISYTDFIYCAVGGVV